ncbi:hypothetical protein JB92DRAFT_407067 [Gautieria morchelliformis]|nr:hypothetical protein JB92DRAFT_407067 [Gautieria morchelliformis]
MNAHAPILMIRWPKRQRQGRFSEQDAQTPLLLLQSKYACFYECARTDPHDTLAKNSTKADFPKKSKYAYFDERACTNPHETMAKKRPTRWLAVMQWLTSQMTTLLYWSANGGRVRALNFLLAPNGTLSVILRGRRCDGTAHHATNGPSSFPQPLWPVRARDSAHVTYPQVNVERIRQQTNAAQRNLGGSHVQAMGVVRAPPEPDLGGQIAVPRLHPAVGYNANHGHYEHQKAAAAALAYRKPQELIHVLAHLTYSLPGRTKNRLVENIRLGLAGIPARIGAIELKQRIYDKIIPKFHEYAPAFPLAISDLQFLTLDNWEDLDAANPHTDAVYHYFLHPGKKPGKVIFKPQNLKVELVITARNWDKIQEHLANQEPMGRSSLGPGGNPGLFLDPPAEIVESDTWSPPQLSQILHNVGKPPSSHQV